MVIQENMCCKAIIKSRIGDIVTCPECGKIITAKPIYYSQGAINGQDSREVIIQPGVPQITRGIVEAKFSRIEPIGTAGKINQKSRSSIEQIEEIISNIVNGTGIDQANRIIDGSEIIEKSGTPEIRTNSAIIRQSGKTDITRE